jgi:hypothetical protein
MGKATALSAHRGHRRPRGRRKEHCRQATRGRARDSCWSTLAPSIEPWPSRRKRSNLDCGLTKASVAELARALVATTRAFVHA